MVERMQTDGGLTSGSDSMAGSLVVDGVRVLPFTGDMIEGFSETIAETFIREPLGSAKSISDAQCATRPGPSVVRHVLLKHDAKYA